MYGQDAASLKEECQQLISFCSFMLQLEPCRHRDVFMWAQGLCFLVDIFNLRSTVSAKQWRQRFPEWHIQSLLHYTFHSFQREGCVYVKLPTSSSLLAASMFYVGSTPLTMEKREANRQAKLRMLRRRKILKAEPVLRYWHQHRSDDKFVKTVLTNSQLLHLSIEHQLIAMWQPRLNHPYITKFFKQKALGLGRVKVRASLCYKLNAKRLSLRHRARLIHFDSPAIPPSLQTAWDTIFALGSYSKKEFQVTSTL